VASHRTPKELLMKNAFIIALRTTVVTLVLTGQFGRAAE
jgi:hypothetical protein